MTTLRMTITVDYPVAEVHYGTSNPHEMARVDQEQLPNNPDVVQHLMSRFGHTLEVEPLLGEASPSLRDEIERLRGINSRLCASFNSTLIDLARSEDEVARLQGESE